MCTRTTAASSLMLSIVNMSYVSKKNYATFDTLDFLTATPLVVLILDAHLEN